MYLSKFPIVVTGKFRLWTGLILTRLVSVPTESNPIRLSTFGFTMEGRTTMKAKAKKPAEESRSEEAGCQEEEEVVDLSLRDQQELP